MTVVAMASDNGIVSYKELVKAARDGARRISLEELRARLDTSLRANDPLPFLLVDVREDSEFAQGSIPGAVHISRGRLERAIEDAASDHETHVVVFCGGGGRAALAARSLRELGYANVESLDPGFSDWKARGYPTTSDASASPLPGDPNPQRNQSLGSGFLRDELLSHVTLDAGARERYARQLVLSEIGEAGQLRLARARVLVVGAGGLGSAALPYLVGAGVGTVGVADGDLVDRSNLHRQVLHSEEAIGTSKVASAASRLSGLNSEVTIVEHPHRLTAENAERFTADYEIVIDASDNFATRRVLNDTCMRLGIPLVHGAVYRFEGRATTFVPARAAEAFGLPRSGCYRCLFPEDTSPELAQNCSEVGVLGSVVGVIGAIQATEAMKVVLGIGGALSGRLFTYDALGQNVRVLRFERNEACSVCGQSSSSP